MHGCCQPTLLGELTLIGTKRSLVATAAHLVDGQPSEELGRRHPTRLGALTSTLRGV